MDIGTPSSLGDIRTSTRYLIYLLLFLASTHCVLSNFFVNFSYLDLAAYQRGAAHNPYQERVAMMPLLREAHNSAFAQNFAAKLRKILRVHPHSAFRDVSSEQLASMVTGLVSVYFAVAFAVWYGRRRFARLWWMPAVIILAMLYVTQAARYESAVWFPYDLPQMAVFGIASVLILEGWWPAAFVLFLIDIPIRETSIYLASIAAAVAFSRRQWKQTIALPIAMFACWLLFRIPIHHMFAHNPNELGVDLYSKRQDLLNPVHWPQVASAYGFMLLPLLLGRRYLSREQQIFMVGALPCLIVTLTFAIWHETRVFCEWILAAAVLLTTEFSAYMNNRDPAVLATAK
jgi:hypothetical protein